MGTVMMDRMLMIETIIILDQDDDAFVVVILLLILIGNLVEQPAISVLSMLPSPLNCGSY